MKSFVALSLSAAVLATPMPQASSSAGCASSVDYTFQITTVLPSKKRQADTLVVSLKDGILTDALGRIGYIASNSQFQFDAPVQAGALQQSGFSLCSNGALALGGSTTWYQCLSGDFYNLYSQSTGAQCSQILIQAVEMGNTASQISDGQPQATSAGVSQISDGQPQATSAGVSQISDGQVQASSAQVVTQISDGQVQATAASSAPVVVTQISDGQIQASVATSVAMVSQISDGQIQASAAVSASNPAAVTQISDGQIQASSAVSASTPAVITQISDGQIQASSAVSASSPAVVTQISDGQVQASAATSHASVYNATATSTIPAVEFTGAAASGIVPMGALAAGLFGLFAMF